ncbi:ATP-binding protein [Methylosinus sp. H3A]|uniref:AAA family ATPase n=1 Tax=Methylosinus sp. H3A TaxID=2785786 RepID=UPI0018C2B3C4|nr:ATP-binding protein [Methylosinus sp. H3A]MBG0811842.1 ATP-binding protein [Methylosinus sp. H3A]
MLLRFSVANFGSIRDEQQLSMIASALKDEPGGLIETPALRSEKILPSAVIYGANASGKSNLVRALAHMQLLVRNSHRQGEPGAPIPLKPFLLDPTYATKPSVFAIDFVWNGARYAYRFEALGNEFTQESLHVWRGGPVTLLFERERQEFKFGRSLKGRNKVIEDLTRPNSLFLSAAAQNNHEELSEVAGFVSSIHVDANIKSDEIVSVRLAEQGLNAKSINFLKLIGSGISSAQIEEVAIGQKGIEFQSAVVSAFEKLIGYPPPPEVTFGMSEHMRELRLGHQTVDDQTVFLRMSDESAGTIQMLAILEAVFSALDAGHVIVIDEFGSCVHTRASELVLSLFSSKESNPNGAQLIVATHDTNLLNAAGLRRDQIWFTEKDETGATHLYPLSDIETRKGDNLEKGYLQGRFGAIPFAGAAADLLKTN